MKIFPLVPNDLVFSFYIQGYKLILAIYVIKGSETSRYAVNDLFSIHFSTFFADLMNFSSLNVLQFHG